MFRRKKKYQVTNRNGEVVRDFALEESARVIKEVIALSKQKLQPEHDRLRKENAELRNQITMLLPWALAGTIHVEGFNSQDVGATVTIDGRVVPLWSTAAAVVRRHIEAGNFGG